MGGRDAGRWLPPPRGTSFLEIFYSITLFEPMILYYYINPYIGFFEGVRGVYRVLFIMCGIGLGRAGVLQCRGMAMEQLGQVYMELDG